jgi:hypothetical protein
MKRPVPLTFAIVSGKLSGQELSLRKQFCLAYLRWGKSKERADMVTFVELALAWRKQERAVGGSRTLLEKRARKLLPEIRRLRAKQRASEAVGRTGRKTVEEGKGVHSPEQRAKRLEANREMVRKRTEAGIKGAAKWWLIYLPGSTEPIKVHNLKAWCRENGYKPSTIRNLKSRPGVKHSGGLRVERWDPLWESNRLDGDG